VETRLSFSVTICEDALYGTVRVLASKWEDGELVKNSTLTQIAMPIAQYEDGTSLYPRAVAVLRDGGDQAVADLLGKMERGEALLMRDVPKELLS